MNNDDIKFQELRGTNASAVPLRFSQFWNFLASLFISSLFINYNEVFSSKCKVALGIS